MVTYKVVCRKCAKGYRTDSKRGERITQILKTNPTYLEDYECKRCKGGQVPKPKPKVKAEVKSPKPVVVEIEVSTNDFGELKDLIPKDCEDYVSRKIGGKTDLEILEYHYNSDDPLMKNVIFIGETGTGKSLCARYFAFKKKVPYYRLVMNAGTTIEDIIGQQVMGSDGKFKFVYQVLINMMKNGGVFVFDEINAGSKELLHILNSITDFERQATVTQHKGEVIKACKDFLVVACCNPPEDYDLQEMSKSLKDRFCTFYFDYDNEVEMKVLCGETKLIALANTIRLARANDQIETPLSTRSLVQFQKLREGMGYDVAKEMLVNKFKNGEKSVIRTMIETHLELSNTRGARGGSDD